MNLDSPLPSNVLTFQIPAAGIAITAGNSGGIAEGYIQNVFGAPFTPAGSITPVGATISGYVVTVIAVANNSGFETFVFGLANAPTNTAWSISFTDSNNVVWSFNSTQTTGFIGVGQTSWTINLAGPTYPYLITGVTYPITVH